MGRGFRVKIVVLLLAIGTLQVLVAATSLGVLDIGRPAILDAWLRLATAVLPCAQLGFAGMAAWKMTRAGADA